MTYRCERCGFSPDDDENSLQAALNAEAEEVDVGVRIREPDRPPERPLQLHISREV